MFLIASTLFVVTLVLGVVPLYLTKRFNRFVDLHLSGELLQECRSAVLILPCKGLDPGFKENIQALLDQEYPNLDLIFVVAEKEDLAYKALENILSEYGGSGHNTKIVVAGINNQRAQKLTNQLHALKSLTKAYEYIVFMDSDVRPDRLFLRRLLRPLREKEVGATTGFRWYHPPMPTLGSLLRSTWNAGALPFLIDPKRNFVYGGAMAIKRETFDKAQIADRWQNAVSDDFPFTEGVKSLGLEVRFVPSCMAISYEESTIAETIEFTNRQSIISKVYLPTLWWSAAIGHSLANILVIFGIVSLVALLLNPLESAFLIGAGCLLLIPLQMLNARLLFEGIQKILPMIRGELIELRWRYILCSSLASWLSLINTITSAFTNKIVWRGVEYTLVSPLKTIVGRDNSNL